MRDTGTLIFYVKGTSFIKRKTLLPVKRKEPNGFFYIKYSRSGDSNAGSEGGDAYGIEQYVIGAGT